MCMLMILVAVSKKCLRIKNYNSKKCITVTTEAPSKCKLLTSIWQVMKLKHVTDKYYELKEQFKNMAKCKLKLQYKMFSVNWILVSDLFLISY